MNEIEISGFDELISFNDNMILTEADEQRAMKKAIEPAAKKLEEDTPKGHTKKLSKVKISIVREEFAVVGKLRLGAWWDLFQEFGTSQSKKNVGFFERSINSTEDEVIGILTDELLNKK
jgi:HK97 gp10 family phage protein